MFKNPLCVVRSTTTQRGGFIEHAAHPPTPYLQPDLFLNTPTQTHSPMKPPIEFFAHGTPKAQPRVRAYRRGNRAGVYDPGTAEEWKFRIREAARLAWDGTPLSGPIEANLTFWFPRPKGHWRTGKNAGMLKTDAPKALHASKPDRDNLEKAVLDALSGLGIWTDDSQVCCGHVRKRWATTEAAGCQGFIRELPDE